MRRMRTSLAVLLGVIFSALLMADILLPPISVKQQILQEVQELEFADVEVVWEPQWHKDMISEAGLLQLGLL